MTADKYLLLAADSAKRLATNLERALYADNYRDSALMPHRIRRLAEQAQALAKEVEQAQADYEDSLS